MKKFTLYFFCALLGISSMKAQDQVTWEGVPGAFPMTASGTQIWGDYNNDGQLDMFISAGQGTGVTALFKNNGDLTFTEVTTDITILNWSAAVFFDYNNDGNLDLLIAGSVDGTNTAVLTELYENSGEPDYNFVLDENAIFPGISPESGDNGSRIIEVADYDLDGWTDVFINGNAGSTPEGYASSRVVGLYKNNQGTFEFQATPVNGTDNFTPMNGGSLHCGDINRDNYVDLIVSGYVDDAGSVTMLYINDKEGGFTESAANSVFKGQMQGETAFADFNNDGWLDIVEFGRDVDNGWANFAELFINDQELGFTKVENSGLSGGQAVFGLGDINNDGFVDIAAAGWGTNTTFFYNKGDNTFTAAAIVPDSARARSGSLNLVDFTNDGNLDFSIFGYRDGGDGTPGNPMWPDFILENALGEGISSNEVPTAPANFTVTADGDSVVLTWDAATDDFTPEEALRYNVYANAKDGSNLYTFFPVDIETGFLKANGVRPLIQSTSIVLKGFNGYDYNFGVQAVDNQNAGGPFAEYIPTLINNSKTVDADVYGIGDKIRILNHQGSQISYEIYNISGITVKRGICPSGNIVEQAFKKGIYLIQLSDGKTSKVEKVVLN
jgi:hypothetical protein